MRRAHRRGLEGSDPAVRHAPHANVRVAPRLTSGPLNDLGAVGGLPRIADVPGDAFRASEAAQVDEQTRVTTSRKVAVGMVE